METSNYITEMIELVSGWRGSLTMLQFSTSRLEHMIKYYHTQMHEEAVESEPALRTV